MYGTSGNSFVAVVEFGDRVEAFAVTAGGESGDPSSPHFNDQAQNYADGNLRPVYYYPEDIEAHAERRDKYESMLRGFIARGNPTVTCSGSSV